MIPGDAGYSTNDLLMHIRENLNHHDGDDSQALLLVLSELVREYTHFKTVEEYALCEIVGTRHSPFKGMVKGFTMQGAYIRCAFERLSYQNIVETHFTGAVSLVKVENALKPSE